MENQLTTQKANYLDRLTKFSAVRVSKIEDVFSEDTLPPIAALKNQVGEKTVQAILVTEIFGLCEFFNVPKMTDGQVAETVLLLMEEFYYLKPEDFKLCFSKAKMGTYGQVYNRIDGQVIFQWLEAYITERSSYAQTRNENEFKEVAIRNGDTKSIHALYDQMAAEGQKKLEEKKRDDLRKKAIAQWMLEKDLHFQGQDVTEQMFKEYTALNPLDEEYIEKFIQEQK